ncbi:MAG: hypothetical protein ACRDPC_11585 [Solirubrobacteraceae bacterium]
MLTLPTVDHHAATLARAPAAPATVGAPLEPTELPTVGMRAHGTHVREEAGTLAVPMDWLLAQRRATLSYLSARRTGRSVVATGADMMIDYQHRSPTR